MFRLNDRVHPFSPNALDFRSRILFTIIYIRVYECEAKKALSGFHALARFPFMLPLLNVMPPHAAA